MMKNVFYFTIKILFVLKMIRFLSGIFAHVKKQLNQKDQTDFKIMASQPWKQTTSIHILSNTSRSKDNQAMKFGHLIEFNMTNIFLKKSSIKYSGETIPRPFSKK